MRPLRRLDAAAVFGVLALALSYTFNVTWGRAQQGRAPLAFDVYQYSLPNFIYASEAIQRGYGLLWNDLQNCGQPFFGFISSALLYPPNALFLFAPDIHSMIFVHTVLNLTLTGAGMYFFCRTVGLGRLSALFGAVALELGATSLGLANWNFALHAPYVWLPWSLLFTERILRRPGVGAGIGLGIVLTLQLLSGYPQTGVFTYQLICVRVLWELVSRRHWPWRQAFGVLALGLVMPIFLGAVQLLPSLELIRESVRSLPLTPQELNPQSWGWEAWQSQIRKRSLGAGTVFCVVGIALCGPALAAPRVRRLAWFGLFVGGLFVSFSLEGPVQDLYRAVPVLGSLFRDPIRFLWVTSFAFSLIIACGAEAIGRGEAISRAALAAALIGSFVGIAAFWLVSDDTLFPVEWWLLAGTLAIVALLFWRRGPAVARFPLLLLLVLLAVNLYVVPGPPSMSHLPDDSMVYSKQHVFAFTKSRLTEQDRIYQIGLHSDPSLMLKSASIFNIPSVTDYEPQTLRRYAELYVYMITGRRMVTLNDYYYLLKVVPESRPLMNLLALRYIVIDASQGNRSVRALIEGLRPSIRLVWSDDPLRVYENSEALPRAFYVPRARVIADPAILLKRLASSKNRPRQAAYIEEPPVDGFLGSSRGQGQVEIVSSRGEELVLRVDATREGFVFVADQFVSGWEATVDGVSVPIQRANYAFRLVRVPQGQSTVIFRYRPLSLRIGAGVSLLTLLALAAYTARAIVTGRRTRMAAARGSE